MRNTTKTLFLALALCVLSLGVAGQARAGVYLTGADKAYLRSIKSDPNSEWITGLKPVQERALHNLINKNTNPATKKAAVNKFLDYAVAQYLLSLSKTAPAAASSAQHQ